MNEGGKSVDALQRVDAGDLFRPPDTKIEA